MIAYRRIGLESPDEWHGALAGIPHGFNHTWESAHTAFLNDGARPRLHVIENDDRRVVCPFLERDFNGWRDLTTPPGFSGFVGNSRWEGFTELWPRLATEAGFVCGYIVLDPIWSEATYHRESEARHFNDTYVLDLTLPEVELRKRLDQNRRRELASWEKVEAEQAVTDRDLLADFLVAEYPALIARTGLPPSYHLSEDSLRYLCGLPRLLLFGAASGIDVEAMVAIAYTDSVAQVQFIVSTSAGRHRSRALVWAGLRRLKEMGVPILNLGGGSRPGDSVASSKERLRGRKVPLRCARQIYDPDAFAAACHVAKVDPTRDGFFPPYHLAAARGPMPCTPSG